MMRTLLIALVATASLIGCRDNSPSAPSAPLTRNEPARPAKPAWPPIEPDQRIAADPLARNYYIVFDASGSMSDPRCGGGRAKIDAAKQAITVFAESLPKDANIGLTAFDAAGIRQRLALAPAERQDVRRVVGGISAGGVTPLRSAISEAYRALTKQGQQQLGYGEYHLVVVTDGEFNPAAENPAAIVDEIIDKSPVVIHTIGFCVGEEHSLNQPGRIYYKTANSPEELKQGLGNILAESPRFDIKTFK